MSDSQTPADAGTDETGISGDAGFERLVDQAQEDEQAEQQRLTEAEKQKQRIMAERSAVDEDARPVTVHVGNYEFEFTPLPKKVRVWVENSSFEFLGFDEDELRDHPERGADFREVNQRTVDILAEHAPASAYDAEFWREYFGIEERMSIINDILEAADERAGN